MACCCFVCRAFSWSISVPEGKRILLEFLKFDLENHPLCRSDHLTVFTGEGLPIGEKDVERYCGAKKGFLRILWFSFTPRVNLAKSLRLSARFLVVLGNQQEHGESMRNSTWTVKWAVRMQWYSWDCCAIQGVVPFHVSKCLIRVGCGGSRDYHENTVWIRTHPRWDSIRKHTGYIPTFLHTKWNLLVWFWGGRENCCTWKNAYSYIEKTLYRGHTREDPDAVFPIKTRNRTESWNQKDGDVWHAAKCTHMHWLYSLSICIFAVYL